MKRAFFLLSLLPATLFCGNGPANMGYLKVNVVPGSAGLFVDGQYYGPAARHGAALKYSLQPGPHQVTIVDPRYEEVTAPAVIQAGKTFSIAKTLQPKPAPKPPFATLRVICDETMAAVMLNNHYVGHVNEFSGGSHGLQLSPGAYQVRIDAFGGESLLWQQVNLVAGKTTVVRWD